MRAIDWKWLMLTVGLNALLCTAIVWLIPHYTEYTPDWFSGLMLFMILQNIVVIPCLYRFDKRQSKRPQRERVPERVLHLLTLCGGVLGSLYAQRRFHHKTRKRAFQISNVVGLCTFACLIYGVTRAF